MPESAIGHNHATELIETHRPSDFIFDLESPDIPTIPEPIKRDARERRLTELPYEQRKKAKTGLITLEEDFSYGMKDIEDETQQLDTLEQSLLIAGEIPPAVATYIATRREALAGTRHEVQQRFDKGLKTILDYADAQSESTMDPNTSLQTRPALLAEFYRTTFKEYQRTKNPELLRNHLFYALDMNNYKVGNTLLGHADFDIVIATMAKGYRALARYLGNEQTAYGEFDKEDEQMNDSLNTYFPEDSEIRRKLEEAREKGILVEFFKDKAGGDEGFFHITFTKGVSQEDRQAYQLLGEQLMNHVFHETVIPKRHGEHDLRRMQQLLSEFPLQLNNTITQTVENADKSDPENPLFISNEDLQYDRIATALSQYIASSEMPQAILDENLFIRMGAAWSHIDGATATASFFNGTDFEGNPTRNEQGDYEGFMVRNDDGTLARDEKGRTIKDPKKIARFNADINKKVLLGIETGALKDEGEVRNFKLRTVSNEIIGSSLEKLFRDVEENAKPADKINTVVQAMCGDPDMMYQLAALRIDGRMDSIDIPTWKEILDRVMDHYKEQFETLDPTDHSSPLGRFRDTYREIIASTPLRI